MSLLSSTKTGIDYIELTEENIDNNKLFSKEFPIQEKHKPLHGGLHWFMYNVWKIGDTNHYLVFENEFMKSNNANWYLFINDGAIQRKIYKYKEILEIL